MDIRTRLLQAAARVYAETGFRGATTRRIALAAGVNEVTLFRHFGSKSRLLHEAIECSAAGAQTAPLPDNPVDPRAELLAWARHHQKALRERRSLIRTCMGEIEEHPDLIPPEGSATSVAAHELGGYLRRLQREGLAAPDFHPAAASVMLMGVLFADAMGRDVMPDMFSTDEAKAVTQYVDLLLRAIGAAKPEEKRHK
jgi:AcrR family transcriptional regulator